jgi:hypothetical protein
MPDITAGTSEQKSEGIHGQGGALEFQHTRIDAGLGSNLVEDHSYVRLINNDDAQISLQAGGKVRLDAPTDISINSGRNKIETILGDKQVTVGRDNYVTIDGKVSINIGKAGSKEKEAYKKLTDLSKTIQAEAISAAKATTNNRVPCPICRTKVLTQPLSVAAKVSSARAVELMNDVNTGWKHLIRNFKRVIWFIPDIFKKTSTANFHQKTKSCGSPGCVNHTVADLKLSLDSYNKKAVDLIEQNKSQIEELQQALGQGTGGLTLITKGTCFVSTGLAKNESQTVHDNGFHALATGFAKTSDGPALSSKGSPKRTIQVGAIRLTEGDMYLNSSEKFTVNAGAPGISLETNGPLNAHGASVEIGSTDGETHVKSGNLTVVSGAVVKLQGGQNAGETGIILSSDSTHVTGGLTVQGEVVVKGGAHFDGAIAAPFLHVPTFANPVTPSKPPQDVTAPASWYPTNVVHNTLQEVVDNMQRNVPDPTHICQTRILTEYIKKWYGEVMSAVPLEMTITGWALVTTVGFGVGGCSFGGAVFVNTMAYGMWGGFCPVYNHPHNHTKYNEYHAGEVTSPLMMGYDNFQGAAAAGPYPGKVPIPAPVKTGLGTRPGPGSMPGPCGGGGMFIKNRNLDYGVNPDDAFNGFNYVDRGTDNGLNMYTTPEFTQYTYGIKTLSAANIDNLISTRKDTDCT